MNLFRELSEQEQETFRQWARANYQPWSEINGLWHPVIQQECIRINREAELKL